MRHGVTVLVRCVRVLLACAVFAPLLTSASPTLAATPLNEHFLRVWARTDDPVARGAVQRTWIWGPEPISGDLVELYREAPGAQRVVQYFDKNRMEITDPAGDPHSPWFVTNGLLVVELMSGEMQVGDAAFVALSPAEINVAGDPNDAHAPTYATLHGLRGRHPAAVGSVLTQRIDRAGMVVDDPALARRSAVAAARDDVTGHAIASPFWDFMHADGAVLDRGVLRTRALFEDPLYATGRPLTEAYWTTVRVGGTPQDVLVQCFERRCLTWTPENPAGWQVEAGNVGQHYFRWRYESGFAVAAQVATATEDTFVSLGDTVSLMIPAGSLADDAIVSITPMPRAPLAPASLQAVSAVVSVELSGAQQLGTVSLSLMWDPGRLPAGATPDSLVLAFWDSAAAQWVPVPSVVDWVAHRVTTQTGHLSLWQVFARMSETPDEDTDNDGDVPENHAPVARAQVLTLDEDGSVSFTLDASDAEDALTWTILAAPEHGDLVGAAPYLTYIPEANYNGGDGAVWQVSDGVHAPVTATTTFVIDAVNDAPIASTQDVVVLEDQSVAITLHGEDVDGDALVFAVMSGPAHGALSGDAPLLRYTPPTDYAGSDAFTFVVHDGTVGSATVTVSISVTAVDDPPLALPQTLTITEDTSVPVTLAGQDPDGDALTYAIVTGPLHGVLDGVAPNLVYTPSENYSGDDAFTFVVNDGHGTSAPAVVTLVVASENDAPVAGAQHVVLSEDSEASLVLLASDADGDSLTYRIVDAPAHGALTGTGATRQYVPAANYYGSDAFTFLVEDSQLTSDIVTVTLTITAVNDDPYAGDDWYSSVTEDSVDVLLDVLENDSALPDVGETLEIIAVGDFSHGGQATIAPEGVVYTPATDFAGQETFHYTIGDGHGGTASATVTVVVDAVNDPPVAVDDVYEIEEDSAALTLDVLANDLVLPDTDDVLTITNVSGASTGTVTILSDAATLLYEPDADAFGDDVFTYTVADGDGGVDTGTVRIRIAAVNDDPVAQDDTMTILEDSPSTRIDVLGNDTWLPDAIETLRVVGVTQPTHGSVTFDVDGIGYTPHADYFSTDVTPDTFTYTISDEHGGRATGTVHVTVVAVNDAPVVAVTNTGVTFIENGAPLSLAPALTVGDIDSAVLHAATVTLLAPLDGDQERLAVDVSATGIAATYDTGTGVLSLIGDAPPAVYQQLLRSVTYQHLSENPTGGIRSVRVVVDDGAATSDAASVSVEVMPVNDTPGAPNVSNLQVPEMAAGAVIGVLSASDPEGDTLEFSVLGDNAEWLRVVQTGVSQELRVGDAPLDHEAIPTLSVTIRVQDSGGLYAESVVTVHVADVNEAPVIPAGQSFDIAAGSTVDTVIGTVAFSDPDVGQGHVVSMTAGNDAGAFAVRDAGVLTVATPTALTVGTHVLSVTVQDDGTPTLSQTASVMVRVMAVQEPFVATDHTYEDLVAQVRYTVSAQHGLLDGNTQAQVTGAVPDGGGTHGTLQVSADGSFVYDPPAQVRDASDAFTFTVVDGVGTTTTATVTFTISNQRVWFVDNASTAALHDGRSATPFISLAQLQNAPTVAGDVLFLATGVGDYQGGITLLRDQKLIGSGVQGLAFAEVAGLTLPANGALDLPSLGGDAPRITNNDGAGIVLESGNVVRGVTIGSTSGLALTGSAGGGLNVSDVAVTGTGPGLFLSAYRTATLALSEYARVVPVDATGLELRDMQSATLTISEALSITTAGGPGMVLDDVGTVTLLSPENVVIAHGGPALDLRDVTLGGDGWAFATLSSTGSVTTGVSLQRVNGALTATAGSISESAGVGLRIAGGAGDVTYGGTLARSTMTGDDSTKVVSVTARPAGSRVLLTGLVSSTTGGIDVQGNAADAEIVLSGGLALQTGTHVGVYLSGGHLQISGSASKNISTTSSANAIYVKGGQLGITGGALTITTDGGYGMYVRNGTVTVEGAGNTITSSSGVGVLANPGTVGPAGIFFDCVHDANGEQCPFQKTS